LEVLAQNAKLAKCAQLDQRAQLRKVMTPSARVKLNWNATVAITERVQPIGASETPDN
jgi:hypothetical protein